MRCTKCTGPCHEHTSIVLCKVINPFVISHPITIVLFCSIFCSLVPIRDSCTMPSSTDVRFVKRQAFLKARCRLRQAMGWPRGAATVELEARLSKHSSELAHRIWIYIIKEADLHFQVQIRTRIINLASKQIEAINKYFRSSKLECGSIFIDQREFGISVKAHTTYCKPYMRRDFFKTRLKQITGVWHQTWTCIYKKFPNPNEGKTMDLFFKMVLKNKIWPQLTSM